MSTSKPKDWKNDPLSVQRGDYGRNILPTILFVTGRLASGPLCYHLMSRHPLQRLFNIPPPSTGGSITALGLNVPKLPFLVALMPSILATKHTLWLTTMAAERMTFPFAVFGVLADFMYEATSALVYTASAINPLWSERLFYTGMTIFYTGMAVELLAEIQRLVFKRKPENKGKLCTTGFWAVTRHVNYSANVLFGLGFGLAMGGPAYAVATAGMYLSNFTLNAMPSIEAYCAMKYKEQWERYCEKVPYTLIPWIY